MAQLHWDIFVENDKENIMEKLQEVAKSVTMKCDNQILQKCHKKGHRKCTRKCHQKVPQKCHEKCQTLFAKGVTKVSQTMSQKLHTVQQKSWKYHKSSSQVSQKSQMVLQK